MARTNERRKPISLNLSPASLEALKVRAEEEGQRYPAAFAAVLLERAIEEAPAVEAERLAWVRLVEANHTRNLLAAKAAVGELAALGVDLGALKRKAGVG